MLTMLGPHGPSTDPNLSDSLSFHFFALFPDFYTAYSLISSGSVAQDKFVLLTLIDGDSDFQEDGDVLSLFC